MQDHQIEIIKENKDIQINFADNFNAAAAFIDRHIGEGRAEKVMIETTSGQKITYRQLAENVNRCGNAFLDLGIKPGERIIMVIKDCPEFFYVFWGAIKAGLIPIPINTLLRAKDYSFIISDSICAALVYSPEYEAEIGPAYNQSSHKPAYLINTEKGEKVLNDLMSKASTELSPSRSTADDPCLFLYSSGSTGNPKGAVHAHRDMVVTSVCYGVNTLGIKESDKCFSAAKLFFAYGHGNALHFPLWVGASTVLLDGRPTPETTFKTIEKFKPTLYFGVPTLYAAQLQALDSETRDLSSIRVCVSAGEALPTDIFKRWKEKTGLIILDGIGSTEILHIFISNRLDDYLPGATGRLVPGYKGKILDEEGNLVQGGDSGMLFIQGNSVALKYFNNPKKTKATFVDGWVNTGDTYIQDEAGYFHYCGRNDDMLKVGGIWCSPFEIEAKLAEHPAVLEAAVVGRADENNLIKPEAFIILTDPSADQSAIEAELIEHCKKGLAPYKYPRWFNFEEELPKTATGKIQRFKLRG